MSDMELKSCPFCGHSEVEYKHDPAIHHGFITCPVCKSRGPMVYSKASSDGGEEKAALKWNERRRRLKDE